MHLTAEWVIFEHKMVKNIFDVVYFIFRSDIEVIVNQIVFEEPLITESKKPHLRKLIYSEKMMKCCFAWMNNRNHFFFPCRIDRKAGEQWKQWLLSVQNITSSYSPFDKLCLQQIRRQIYHRKLWSYMQSMEHNYWWWITHLGGTQKCSVCHCF